MSFIETPRFPDNISYGSRGGPGYSTTVVRVDSGYESRNINWTYPLHQYDVSYGIQNQADMYSVIEMFHSMAGRGHGFRFKDWSDLNSTTDQTGATALTDTDQALGTGDGTTVAFQLIKSYTTGTLTRIRKISKPIAGTTIVSIGGVSQANLWTVSTVTGIVTFSADVVGAITDATKANPCVITDVAHGLVTNDTTYIAGVSGMTELNGSRYTITKLTDDTYELNVDSSAFGVYSGPSGVTNTIPQSGESVAAGYGFDVPVRFDSDELNVNWDAYQTQTSSIMLTEVRL